MCTHLERNLRRESDGGLYPLLSLCSLLGEDWLPKAVTRVHVNIEVIHVVSIHVVPETEALVSIRLSHWDLGADKAGLVPGATGGRRLDIIIVASCNRLHQTPRINREFSTGPILT
jgi:hypothetical protein